MVVPDCATIADDERIREAVVRVRQLLVQTVQRGLEEVGQFLLDQFYNGCWQAYRSNSAHKHVSLRLLMDRCGTPELPVNKTWLARAIHMAALSRQLPRTSRFLALPASHRQELMRIKDVGRLEALSARAWEAKLTVARLRSMVHDELERSKSTRGRKRIPKVLRALNQCMKALRDESTGKLLLYRDDVRRMDAAQTLQARQAARSLHHKVEELLELLH